jgi:hypothetical protein
MAAVVAAPPRRRVGECLRPRRTVKSVTMPETRLEQARRLAMEGRQRITRQEAIDERLLEEMRAIQNTLEAHLLLLEEREAAKLRAATARRGRGLWSWLRAAWRGE